MTALVPDLFLVGAAKAGTTSLYHQLAQHPDVHAPSVKEPHWAASDLGLAADRGLAERDAYLRLYADGAAARHRIDGSPSSLLSRVAARRIHELSPNAQVVITLRDPVEVVPALHDQLALGGLQAHPDLAEAVDHALGHRGASLTGLGWRAWTRYLDVVDYAPQVQRYLDVFAPDRVHVVWFDDLRADPAATFAKLLDRIGLPPVSVDLSPRNTAMRVTNPRLQRLVTNPPLEATLRRVVPRGAARRVRAAVTRRNVRIAPRAPVPDTVRQRLADELRPGVAELGRLLGRDLTGWCRP